MVTRVAVISCVAMGYRPSILGMNESPHPLEYKGPSTHGQNWWTERHYSPWVALLLCAPGAACFAAYFGGGINGLPWSVFFSLWITAIVTAIISVCLYGRFPFKALPWFVAVNLVINIFGLLLSLLAIRLL